MIPVVVGLFGREIGSFLNVVIHQVPLRRPIVWPSSSCPHCGARIKTLDNVPVLSYLLLRGRCRECGARISPRYPLAEALTGGLFALALAYAGGMGMGNVKMGGMLEAFLGPYAALTVFLGAFLGALVGGVLMARGKVWRRSALPFGVFLDAAGVFTLFLGQELWGSYLRLIGGRRWRFRG